MRNRASAWVSEGRRCVRGHGVELAYVSALAGLFLVWGGGDLSAVAQDPFSAITTKAEETRDQIVTIGQAVVGVVAAALFVMAIFGRVAWHWVGMAVVGAAGLSAVPAIQDWLNS